MSVVDGAPRPRLRPGELVDPTAATKVALRSLATRHEALEAELERLDAALARLIGEAAPELVARFGVGPDSAGALLVAAGDNPGRLRSEAAFAMLCGAFADRGVLGQDRPPPSQPRR